MKLLYFYTEFLDGNGASKPFRGLEKIEMNLSARDRFRYDKESNTLGREPRKTPLPENFWANEAAKAVKVERHAPSKITNLNVIAGQNGSGKSTVVQYLIDFLDALYGAITKREHPIDPHRFDPRPHRALVLLEDSAEFESNNTNKADGSARSGGTRDRYLLDYSPEFVQKDSVALSEELSSDGRLAFCLSFHDWDVLSADSVSDSPSEAERAREALARLIRRTKLIFITNTLTQRDYSLHVNSADNERLRDAFVYDGSLASMIGPNVSAFFPYEVYKQVKYVFDKGQFELRKQLEQYIPELRLPHTLTFRPRIETFRQFFTEQTDPKLRKLLDSPADGTDGSGLAGVLSALCAAAYAENMKSYLYKLFIPHIASPQAKGSKVSVVQRAAGAAIEAICNTASSMLFVSGSGDGTLRVWNPAAGQCLQTLRGHSGSVRCVAVFPDGRVLSGSVDCTLRVWDPDTGGCLQILEGHSNWVSCAAALPDGRILSGSEDKTLRVWDPDTGQCLQILEGHSDTVFCAAVLPGGRVLSGSYDHTLRIWDLTAGQCLQTLKGHSGSVTCAAVLPDGRVLSGSQDNTLRVWDPETGQCLQTLRGHSGSVRCVAVFPDGRVLSGSYDCTLRIWDPDTGKCLQTLEGHSAPVFCVAVLSEGRVLSGSWDRTLRVWDPTTGQCMQMLEGHSASVYCVAVLPNHRADDSFPKSIRDCCLRYLEFLWRAGLPLLSRFRRLPDGSGWELDLDEAIREGGIYELLIEFIEKYRDTCEPAYTLDFDWGLSSGEENMLRLFSNLYHIFDRDYNNEASGDYAIYNNEAHRPFRELTEPCDTVLLFLDEADLTFHPEWQRRLIHLLTAFLPRLYPAPCTKEMQLILTTHSPLLLGDIPRENVIYLDHGRQIEPGEQSENGTVPGESFGQNIHTILKQSFFLGSGTVGEFAAAKINAAARRLRELAERKEAEPEVPKAVVGKQKERKQTECSPLRPGEMEDLRRTVALTAPGILRAGLEELLRRVEDARQPEEARQAQLARQIRDAAWLTEEQRTQMLRALEQGRAAHD